MRSLRRHREHHSVQRIGWLRAAVLGANDGILSTASLMVGIAASNASRANLLLAGIAALVAGAMSMAAGEYVSVSSQADSEQASLAEERRELVEMPDAERDELAGIYVARGLDDGLARQVAEQLMAKDALAAHARDELGMSELSTARPLQAAFTSAITFSSGAAAPLLAAVFAPPGWAIPLVFAVSLLGLIALGAVGAKLGGAKMLHSVARVAFWGALAMAVTAGIGRLVGTVV